MISNATVALFGLCHHCTNTAASLLLCVVGVAVIDIHWPRKKHRAILEADRIDPSKPFFPFSLSLIMSRIWKHSTSASGALPGNNRRLTGASFSSSAVGRGSSIRGSSSSSSSSSKGMGSMASSASSIVNKNNNKNNGSNNHHSGESAPPSSQNGEETMFLEFGVSVENIDEQTRSIRTEIEAVEKGNQQIKEGIKQEECTAHQLRKDSAHACSEMMELRTTSSDLLDSANMNEQTRRDLEKTLHAELVQPLKNKSSNTGGADQNQPQDVSDNNGATSATTTKDFLQQCHQRASTLFQSDNKDNNSNTLAKAKAEFAVIEQDIVAIEERIQKENLHEKLAQKKEEANARRQDLEAEMSRKEAVQKIMSQSRGRCGDYAQDIADKRKALAEIKSENEPKLAKLRQELEASRAELKGIKTKEQWELELAAVNKEREEALKKITEAKALIAKRKMVVEEYKAIQASNQELKATETDLESTVTALKERVGQAETEVDGAKKDAAEVEAMKLDNDTFEAEKVLPAKSELNDVLKEKEEMAKCISDAHEDLNKHTEQVNAAAREDEKEIQKLEEKVQGVKRQLEASAMEKEELKQSKEVADKAQKEEIQKLQSSVNSMEEAAKLEAAHVEESNQKFQEALKKVKIDRDEAVYDFKGKERLQKALELGRDMITFTDNQIAEIKESVATMSDSEDSDSSEED